jgi:hypothetical protein
MITLLPDITDAPGKTTRGSFLSPRACCVYCHIEESVREVSLSKWIGETGASRRGKGEERSRYRVASSISVTSKEKKEALYIGPKSNIQVGRTSVLDRKNWPDGRGRSISNRVWNDQP